MMHRLLAECSADGRASLARLTDTSLRDAGNGLLNRHGYVLNAADQRTKVSRTNSAATAWNGYGIYTYDAAGEVRTARAYDGSGAAVASENFDYGYDAGWNLLKRTNNTAVTPYAINVLNQISNDGGSSWVHDANGNLTFRPNAGSSDLSYAYDAENQLQSVSATNAWKIEFTYDGQGRLRVRKDYTWSTLGGTWTLGVETRYLYDGMLLVQERSSANNPLATYTRGTDLSGSLSGVGGIGGLLSRGVHATTSPYAVATSAYYHADGNGNVTLLVGSGSPSVKAYYKYDPFGQTLASGGSLASDNVMRFSSKPVMGSSGLYYYGYRFYDPTSQRWLNRDPLGEIGGINHYTFCHNNPVIIFDTDGRIDVDSEREFDDEYLDDANAFGGKWRKKKLCPKPLKKPKDCPLGIVSIDEYFKNFKNRKNVIHQVKNRVGGQSGDDWMGVDEEGNVWYNDGFDHCKNAGPWRTFGPFTRK